MHDFTYQGGELYCEGVPISRIAKEIGTPCYVYSHATLVRHFRAYDRAFEDVPHLVAFAVKANSNLALLSGMVSEGGGADIVSSGELYRALRAGVPPHKMVFAGVGKSREEIRYALETDILMFNVESSAELRAIDDVAGEMGRRARVALRINPDIDPKTHPYISTGLKKSKFGISADRALDEYKLAASLQHLEVVGLPEQVFHLRGKRSRSRVSRSSTSISAVVWASPMATSRRPTRMNWLQRFRRWSGTWAVH